MHFFHQVNTLGGLQINDGSKTLHLFNELKIRSILGVPEMEWFMMFYL
jgi:hypothetical protein